MLRKLLDYQLSLTDKYPILNKIKPSITAIDTFLYEAPVNTKGAPHIRDAVDLKRWMSLVVLAMLPAILMAIWNTGLQSFVYSSGDYKLMDAYLSSLGSFSDYIDFVSKDSRYLSILKEGSLAFLPVVLVTYMAGGITEMAFACVRRHEIAEGFLVTGMLVPLVLPPTIPLWMVAVGTVVGVILSKELFGGTGMNIINPALTIRAFMFFTFPTRMSGDVWVGRDPYVVRDSLVKMNSDAGTGMLDGYSQATILAKFNIGPEVKQIHIDAIATNNLGEHVAHYGLIEKAFAKWSALSDQAATLGKLTAEQLQSFVTTPLAEGGLGLSIGSYADAYQFSALQHGIGELNSNWLFFLGNKLGSMGETSVLFAILGALIIILTGVGSWRTMVAVVLGTFFAASCFEFGSKFLTADGGAFAPAMYGFPAYKMLLFGGLAFGLVFMATDPVSSCDTKCGRWIYGFMIGLVVIVIRYINPAYPEGVMLAIIMANCFHPLIDYYVVLKSRRKRRVPAPKAA